MPPILQIPTSMTATGSFSVGRFGPRIAWRLLAALLFLLILASIWLVVWRPYWGLEYEDAFVYSDCAQFMLRGYPWSEDVFKTKSILSGSLLHPLSFGTYGGHSEALPLVIAACRQLFGSGAQTALFVSACCSSALLVAFGLLTLAGNRRALPLLLAIWLSAPTVLVYQSSGFSEPLSSVLIAAFIWVFFAGFLSPQPDRLWLRTLSPLFMAAAIAVKRENLILFSLFPLAAMFLPQLRRQPSLWFVGTFGLAWVLFYWSFFKFAGVEANEGGAIGAATFSISNFYTNAPRLLEALIRPDFWGVVGILAIISMFLPKRSGCASVYWLSALLAVGYFMLYSSHYRSVYQVRDGDVQAYEMLRYSLNIFPCALTMLWAVAWPRWSEGLLAGIVLVILAPILFYFSFDARSHFSSAEIAVRFSPAVRALAHVRPGEAVVTDTPMCARLIAPESVDIRDRGYLISQVEAGGDLPIPSFLVIQEYSTSLDGRDLPGIDQYERSIVEQDVDYRVVRFTVRGDR
jgi:hypothetical protein